MINRGVFSRIALPFALLLILVVGTGCVAQLGTGWAGLTVLNDGVRIAYAYEDTLALVNAADGTLVPITDSEGEARLDADGNPLEWRISGNDFENDRFFAPPVQLDDETMLVGTQNRRLLQVDLRDAQVISGTAEPLATRGTLVAQPLLAGNQVLVGLQDLFLSFDFETGEQNWTFETGHAVWAQPIVLSGVAYFVSLDHRMYAVDVESGNEIWQLDLGGAAASTPVYDETTESLFIGTFDSKILRISLDGEIQSEYETDEWVWGDLRLVDGMLYAADLDGMVYKLDPATFSEANGWKSQVANGGIRTPPLVLEDYVIVGSRDQSVYWLDRETGAVVFDRPLDGEVLSDILYFPQQEEAGIQENMIVVSTLSNREALVAFTSENGERLWTFRR